MGNNTSLESKVKHNETKRRREMLLASCMAHLATGLGVEITKERIVLYLRPLEDLTDSQIKLAFRTALNEYKPYGGSFPAPAELLAYARRASPHQGFPDDAPAILKWEKPERDPVSIEELRAEIEKRKACAWPV